jgi:ribose 5-phosphate isomerase B
MRIGLASDHRGFNLKENIKDKLKELGYEIIDCGTYTNESSDHMDYAFKLGDKVVNKEVDYGVAICGTGIGMSIACNKMKGVRCAKVDNNNDVVKTRLDNDSNVISFGENTPVEKAIEWIKLFISTPKSMEERYIRRRNKLQQYEENHYVK